MHLNESMLKYLTAKQGSSENAMVLLLHISKIYCIYESLESYVKNVHYSSIIKLDFETLMEFPDTFWVQCTFELG